MTAPWWEGPLVGLDTETTGTDVETARIVTACVVLDEPGREPRSWTWLVNPGAPIPAEATAVHGVTDEMAAEGLTPGLAVAQIALTLAGFDLPLVAFNGAYDFTVMDREARRHGLDPFEPFPVVDPYVLDKQAEPYRRGKRTLSVTCEHYGIPLGEDAHDAAADALAAVRLGPVRSGGASPTRRRTRRSSTRGRSSGASSSRTTFATTSGPSGSPRTTWTEPGLCGRCRWG